MPMMPFSGVRISWEAIARKRDLARLAASAWSRASPSARSVSVRSVTSRPTLCISEGALASLRTRPSRQAIQRAPSAVAIFWSWTLVPLVSIAASPCSSTVSEKSAADQFFARQFRQFAIGVVDEGDAAVAVAQHDQVALQFEQAAGALLGLLQFPIAVGQRFIMQRELFHFLPHPAQPEAQRGEPQAGQREQEAGADREGVRIVTGALDPAAGDEAIGAAEGGGEDHEGADGEGQPGMAPGEPAYMHLDPENPPFHAVTLSLSCRACRGVEHGAATLRSA